MKNLLTKKHKDLKICNFALTFFDYSLITSCVKKQNFILSKDFITDNAVIKLDEIFTHYHQSEFVIYSQFGYDYWNLDNVKVIQHNMFLFNILKNLIELLESFLVKKRSKDFSVFIGSNCKERIDFLTSLGIIGKLQSSNYSMVRKDITPYFSDSKKYEFLFGEKFENYQLNFKEKSYDASGNYKYDHKNNFKKIKPYIEESQFYIGLENMPYSGKDNLSEKSFYGYILGKPTFHVVGLEARDMLYKLGFKSTPLFDISKDYNKKSRDETMLEYMKDVSFLCNLSQEQWDSYYQQNLKTLKFNQENLNNAFDIIKNNIHRAHEV